MGRVRDKNLQRPIRRTRKNRRLRATFRLACLHPRVVAGSFAALFRRCLPALITVASICATIGGGYAGYTWLTTSSRFAVDLVDVRGNEALSAQQIRDLLEIDQKNLFQLNLARLEHRLEREPWIARAAIKRRLPSTLIIEVEENQPAAVVELGGLYLTDARGDVFKRVELRKGEGAGLPIVTGVSRGAYIADPAAAAATIQVALAQVDTYARNPERPSLGEIHLDPDRGTSFHAYDRPLSIRVGTASAAATSDRLAIFDAAWSSLDKEEQRSARTIYVNNKTHPNRVTVGFARTAQKTP